MYFLIDAIIIALTILLVVISIKFGFTRNFVFGILRTIIGIAGAFLSRVRGGKRVCPGKGRENGTS